MNRAAIVAANHPHLAFYHCCACIRTRLDQRSDPPPLPTGEQPAFDVSFRASSRAHLALLVVNFSHNDDAVLVVVGREARRAKLG